MAFFDQFFYFFNHVITSVGIRDIIEIIFLSISIYGLTRLFTADSTTKLLVYFYYYCGLLFIAYTFNLDIITWALITTAPCCTLLFFLFHQKQLQKNFITLRSIHCAKTTELIEIPELIIRNSLNAFSHKKKINWIIQHNDILNSFLTTQCHMQAPLTQELFNLITSSPLYDSNMAFWINSAGTLYAINAAWNFEIDLSWHNYEIGNLSDWQQYALTLSTKTDAQIVQTNPLDHTFTILTNGHLYQNLSTQQALQLLKKNNPSKKYHLGALIHEKESSKIIDQSH